MTHMSSRRTARIIFLTCQIMAAVAMASPQGRCAETREASSTRLDAVPDDSVGKPSFGFILIDHYCCTDSVNTFTGRYTHFRGRETTTLPLTLTPEEMERIHSAMILYGIMDIDMNTVGYPRCDSILKVSGSMTVGFEFSSHAGMDGYFRSIEIHDGNRRVSLTLGVHREPTHMVFSDVNGKEIEVDCDPKPWQEPLGTFLSLIGTILSKHAELKVIEPCMCL
jgi:hypothetical protein